jgi:hypothetical protein
MADQNLFVRGIAVAFLVFLFFACFLAAAIGDPFFAHAMRKRAPDAFVAAGSPSPGTLALLTPFFFSAYHRFIFRRQFTLHLQPGTNLYAAANFLFVAHALLIVSVVVMALSLATSWLLSVLGGAFS